MAASIVWDLIKPGDISRSLNGFRVTRGLMVTGLAPVINPTYGTDPGLLLKCLAVSGFPQIGDAFPDSSYSYLTVRNQRLVGVLNKTYSVVFAIDYEGLDNELPPAWVVQEDYNISFVQTASTSGNTRVINVWYKTPFVGLTYPTTGYTSDIHEHVPPGSDIKTARVHKKQSQRMIRAIGNMATSRWIGTYAPLVRAIAGTINSDGWHGSRGQWYFVGPKTVTRNFGTITQATLDFLYDPKGHYPVVNYYNRLGNHPSDGNSEADVRLAGPPAVDNMLRANGITICSVEGESSFSSVFTGDLFFNF
jgi:hypothetical protein